MQILKDDLTKIGAENFTEMTQIGAEKIEIAEMMQIGCFFQTNRRRKIHRNDANRGRDDTIAEMMQIACYSPA